MANRASSSRWQFSSLSLFHTSTDDTAIDVDAVELKKSSSDYSASTFEDSSNVLRTHGDTDDDFLDKEVEPVLFLPRVQLALRRILCATALIEHRHSPLVAKMARARSLPARYRAFAQFGYIALVLLLLGVGLHFNNFAAATENGNPALLNCTATWESHAYYVQRDGLSNATWANVRCQAFCSIFSLAPVESANSSSFLATSPICKAAIDAGYVSSALGGCAVVRGAGEGYAFEVAACQSQSFCAYYNLAFFGAMLVGFALLPLVSPSANLYAGCIFVSFFWYVVLISQPRYTALFYQDSLATFLPYLVVCYILYQYCMKPTLYETAAPKGLPFAVDSWLCYFLPCFLFLHMNFVKPFLNFSLTSNGNAAVQQLSGGRLVGFLVIAIIVKVSFIYLLKINRDNGRLPRILAAYSLITVAFIAVSFIVRDLGLSFHLHHYALGALLMPVTAVQTRFAAICQSALLGVFINGAAAYGFHSMWVVKQIHH